MWPLASPVAAGKRLEWGSRRDRGSFVPILQNTNTIRAALAAIKRLRAELLKISWLKPR